MSYEILSNEKSVVSVKLIISKEAFEKGINAAYNKNKGRFNVPGFRKGKAPRAIIESKFGKGIFYEDAVDEAFPEVYADFIRDAELNPVALPTLDEIESIDENGVVLLLSVPVEPTFELPQYKGIKVGSLEYTATEEDIDAKIAAEADKNARVITVTDDTAKEGDTLKIDFEGFENGVAFDGGKGENYDLTLGSGTFIPGFEEALIGAEAESEVQVNVTFPEEYHSEALAGKPAVFKVYVHEIKRKELPAIDEDFALDLGYDNLQAMRDEMAAKVKAEKEAQLKQEAEQKIMSEIIENTEMDIAEAELKEQTDKVRESYEARLRQYGFEPEQYYQYVLEASDNKDPNQFEDTFKAQAANEIKSQYITKKILEVENLVPTEEDFEAEYVRYAEAYGQTVEEFKAQYLSNESVSSYIASSITQNKFYDFLLENADTTPIE